MHLQIIYRAMRCINNTPKKYKGTQSVPLYFFETNFIVFSALGVENNKIGFLVLLRILRGRIAFIGLCASGGEIIFVWGENFSDRIA